MRNPSTELALQRGAHRSHGVVAPDSYGRSPFWIGPSYATHAFGSVVVAGAAHVVVAASLFVEQATSSAATVPSNDRFAMPSGAMRGIRGVITPVRAPRVPAIIRLLTDIDDVVHTVAPRVPSTRSLALAVGGVRPARWRSRLGWGG